MDQYVQLAKELHMENAVVASPDQIHFDIRAMLKCLWGCTDFPKETLRCSNRNLSFQERVEIVRKYNRILVVHSHDAEKLSRAVLELERIAFLDGHYFAFAVRACNLCAACRVKAGEPCLFPEKVRPCDQMFGIDVYKTVRGLGLPCEVLQGTGDVANRYGFVLID